MSASKSVAAPVAAPKAHPVKAAKFPETATITLVADKNPKRAASAKRFALYGKAKGDTTTVKAYLDGCAELHADEPRYRWRADLAWDLQRGFIEIA